MPKKKAVPDPASEQEMEPVSAVESAEDPSAAEAGMAEVAAPLPDADAAVAPLEEGAPKPDAPVQATEDPPADGQDMAPEQEVGGVMELDAGEETAPEILGLEPGPAPDAADGTDRDVPAPEDPAGMSWPDAVWGAPGDIPEWEQPPFPDLGRGLDGAVSEADGISPPAEGLETGPSDGPDGAEVPVHGEAGDGPERASIMTAAADMMIFLSIFNGQFNNNSIII